MEVWNGIWKKILVWNGRFLVWNGRKLPVRNMEKSSSIPFHTMPCLQVRRQRGQGAMPPDFRFCPLDFFLAPHGIFLEEVGVLGRKKR